ncbi:MAG: peptidylprolyl isomerase [Pirellulales bacterium]
MGTGIFSFGLPAAARLAKPFDLVRPAVFARGCVKIAAIVAGIASLAEPAAASQFARLDCNLYIGSRYRHTIFLELFDDRPLNVANFLAYVNSGQYDGSFMHRLALNPSTFNPFVIQGGGYYPQLVSEPNVPAAEVHYSLNPNATVDLDGNYSTPNPTVTGEAGNAPLRSNVKGTISMALSTGPNSGTSQWFINLDSNTFLDSASSGGPFTVFSKVAGDGMNYVDGLVSSLIVRNLNPDANDDGVREAGPFYNSSATPYTDGAPLYVSGGSFTVAQILSAQQIDYLGAGVTTDVPSGGLFFVSRNAVIDTGTVFTGSGMLGIGPGRTLQAREGVSLGHSLISHGTFSPGLQVGTVAMTGYQQYSDATLEVEIAGATADTQYDKVAVLGSAFLSGKLDVNFIGSYLPDLNTSFTILTATSITGNFTSFDLPQLAAGYVWNISRTATAYTLTVAAGDYNRDGVVNAADYSVWRESRNTSVTPGSGADGDKNGLVNDADLAIWRANFGNVRGTTAAGSGSSLGANVAPEPASAATLLWAAAGFAARRRRRYLKVPPHTHW